MLYGGKEYEKHKKYEVRVIGMTMAVGIFQENRAVNKVTICRVL